MPVRAELAASIAMMAGRLDAGVVRGWKQRRERSVGLARRLPQPRNLIGLVAQRIDDLAERLPNALNARAAQVALRLTNAGSRLRPALLTARLERSSERLAGASRGWPRRWPAIECGCTETHTASVPACGRS